MRKLLLIFSLLLSLQSIGQTPMTMLIAKKQVSSGYDSDAQAFITRWETAAGSAMPDLNKGYINDFVVGCKADGNWAKLTEFWIFYGNTASTHALSFKNATYNLTFNNSPTHSGGITSFNGSNQIAETNFIADGILDENDAHFSYYSHTSGAHGNFTVGAVSGTGQRMVLNPKHASLGLLVDMYHTNGSGRVSAANSDGTGFYIASRYQANDLRLYKNGTQQGSTLAALAGVVPTNEIFVGGYNNSGTPVYVASSVSFVSIGTGLSPTQAAALNTRVEALADALGRGVQ